MLNAIGNLELTGAYADALIKLGHTLENVARQVRCGTLFSSNNCLTMRKTDYGGDHINLHELLLLSIYHKLPKIGVKSRNTMICDVTLIFPHLWLYISYLTTVT